MATTSGAGHPAPIELDATALGDLLDRYEADENLPNCHDKESVAGFITDLFDEGIVAPPGGAEVTSYFLSTPVDPGFVFSLRPVNPPDDLGAVSVTTPFVELWKRLVPRDLEGRESLVITALRVTNQLTTLVPAYHRLFES